MSSQSFMERGMPAWRAMALRWIGALVDPPMAEQTTIAFSKACRVRMSDGLMSSSTISTARFGERIHGRGGAHRVAMSSRWRSGRDRVDIFRIVDFAGGQAPACRPFD